MLADAANRRTPATFRKRTGRGDEAGQLDHTQTISTETSAKLPGSHFKISLSPSLPGCELSQPSCGIAICQHGSLAKRPT